MSQLFPANPRIFADTAPKYFARGVPVIPLEPYNSNHKSKGKKPLPYDWSQWKDKPIPAELQQQWLERFPWANIGIAAGPQSGLFFIDVDSTDPRITDILKSLIPDSPWVRTGKKGFVAAYKWAPYIKNFKIMSAEHSTLIECLGAGNQAVIPPSIHPDTRQPYTANCELLDVINFLPAVPDQLETMLRSALIEAGFKLHHSGGSRMTDWVPVGMRDNMMVSMAGMCARDITTGRITLQQALDRMETWHSTLVERNQKVAGDDIDLQKGKQRIIEFLVNDVTGEKKRPLPLGWDKNLDPTVKAECEKIFTRDHEEWTGNELRDNLLKQFIKFPSITEPKRVEAINQTLEKIARSPSLTNLDKEMIYSYIHQQGRIPGLTVSNLRKRVKEIQRGGVEGSSHTEIAEAVMEYMQEFYGDLRFHNGFFWKWNGAQWEKLEETDILRHIAQEFGELDLAKRYNDHKGILQVLRNISTRSLGASTVRGINFANGYLALIRRLGDDGDPGELRMLPHNPEFGATMTLTYRYMPELGDTISHQNLAPAHAPRFAKLLKDAWGHDDDYAEKVMCLQDMIAITLFGQGTHLQRVCLLFGVAQSGKSTILQVMSGLFPDHAVSYCPPDGWQDRFAPATMTDKVLNVAGELDNKKLIEGKVFKEVVDGTPMQGQLKGQQIYNFIPSATHWFGSNHLPKTTDSSEGFNRRWAILHFNKPTSETDKIIDLGALIVWEEREAIAAWAAPAILRVMRNKSPHLPPSHEQLVTEMSSENNSVRFFFTRCPRVLTLKKVLRLSQKLTEAGSDPIKQERILAAFTGIGGRTALTHGASGNSSRIPLKLVLDPAAFEIYAKENFENHTSESALFSEYTSFCQKEGGVKAVGLRAFKQRVQEITHEHGFTMIQQSVMDSWTLAGVMIGSIDTGN